MESLRDNMNQVLGWNGNCQFCGKETDEHTMSIYDVKLICLECSSHEFEPPAKPARPKKIEKPNSTKS
jgi:NADH pyrophosphatase NudC (nudix superfamily)